MKSLEVFSFTIRVSAYVASARQGVRVPEKKSATRRFMVRPYIVDALVRPNRVRTARGRVEPTLVNPAINDSNVLPSDKMR